MKLLEEIEFKIPASDVEKRDFKISVTMASITIIVLIITLSI